MEHTIYPFFRIVVYTGYMNFPTKPSKFFVIERIRTMLLANPKLRILDIGSGQSRNFLPLLSEFSECTYVGLEPYNHECLAAQEVLQPFTHAKVIHGFADVRDLGEQFDLVVSLSVLEHVKHLDTFFDFAARHTVTGGSNIHLYDLGHALYPSSFQERLHVLACRLPLLSILVPKSYWTSYLSPKVAESVAKSKGFHCDDITYHNCPQHVQIIKHITHQSEMYSFLQYTNDYEQRAAQLFTGANALKEKIFPSIALWLTKQ